MSCHRSDMLMANLLQPTLVYGRKHHEIHRCRVTADATELSEAQQETLRAFGSRSTSARRSPSRTPIYLTWRHGFFYRSGACISGRRGGAIDGGWNICEPLCIIGCWIRRPRPFTCERRAHAAADRVIDALAGMAAGMAYSPVQIGLPPQRAGGSHGRSLAPERACRLRGAAGVAGWWRRASRALDGRA